MTEHPELIDVPLDENGAPIPGVTPRGWYLDPSSPTGERAWSGKTWGLGKKRPNGIPLGPAPTFGEHMAAADAARAAKEAARAARFAEDFPELAATPEAAAIRGEAPVPAAVIDAALNAEVAKYARKGYTVTDRTPGQVILQRKKPMGFLYLMAMILLAVSVIGLLLIFPLLRAINGKKETVVITVDDAARVKVRTT
ncbi:hypothetical protein PBI_PERCIVAL_57 [Microbacterium phage Percival]|uniref:DUF2510 domain-containing protein n=1 Tax=Microbacterium phage Percival TaxID=2201439 RepID=A0A2Z4Q6Y8_9CAUD|nr:hypothetical protein PBI_PERCIVAL_57 [Microbacterium phage Percival]